MTVELKAPMLLAPDAFRRLCQARDRLQECSYERRSIADIAREAHISPFHFIRRFEALFGFTPHQFRIQSRIERAKLLLACENLSVTEVCMDLGFSSLGSFSELFTRRVGEPPSAYQRRARVLILVPRNFPQTLFPGCLTLMTQLPPNAFRNFR